MDQPQYTKRIEALRHIPDPRQARGKQLEWTLILGVIACALLCQQRSVTAIADWVQHQQALLLAAFQPARQRLPSEATIRRALRAVDVSALEQHLATLIPTIVPPPSSTTAAVHGWAVDGKYVRGAGTHGQPTRLVSLVHHASARILGQTTVPDKHHESRGVAALLSGRDLRGMVITLDAGLTHPRVSPPDCGPRWPLFHGRQTESSLLVSRTHLVFRHAALAL